jgi:hypothetical protein
LFSDTVGSLDVRPVGWSYFGIILRCLVAASNDVASSVSVSNDIRPHWLPTFSCSFWTEPTNVKVMLLSTRLLRLHGPHRGHLPNLKSELLYHLRAVSQYLGVEPSLGIVTRYYFLPECCSLKVAVLFLWGTFSDERTGLQFAV